MSDLKLVYDSIKAKQGPYDTLDDYYAGNQPTVYLTQRLREVFRGVDIEFVQNWCSVVVDACKERINLRGFQVKDKAAQSVLDAAWEENELALESDDVHQTALVCSEAYLVVWPDEQTGRAEAYFNDPRMAHVEYDPLHPKRPRLAGKLWEDAAGFQNITLYYPDHLEYYRANAQDVSDAGGFLPLKQEGENWPANEYGIVPVFHFRTNRRKISDLRNVIPIQNGVNKLLSDMMVAAEYGAFGQRWVISDADLQGRLSAQPGGLWQIPPADGQTQPAQVGQFSASDLGNYLQAINDLAGAIGKITSTPRHYFYTQGGDPSGEALIAMEAPLNKKAAARIERFTPVWKAAAAFICQINGASVDASDITPLFDQPETVQPRTNAEITQIRVASGVPLVTALRWEGRSTTEIEQMQKDADEASKKQTSLASALLAQVRTEQEQQNADHGADDDDMPRTQTGREPMMMMNEGEPQ